MSGAGRPSDNLTPFTVSGTPSTGESKTYNGIEKSGVRLHINQTVGVDTTLNVYTAGNSAAPELRLESLRLNGTVNRIIYLQCLSTLRLEVQSDAATTITVITKPTEAAGLKDLVAEDGSDDQIELNKNIRHYDMMCVLRELLKEAKLVNTYFGAMFGDGIKRE